MAIKRFAPAVVFGVLFIVPGILLFFLDNFFSNRNSPISLMLAAELVGSFGLFMLLINSRSIPGFLKVIFGTSLIIFAATVLLAIYFVLNFHGFGLM